MRWGVRDEATDDHMTTELCMKEIENCQRLSMGPNFVVSNNPSISSFQRKRYRFQIDLYIRTLEIRELGTKLPN